MTIRLEENRGLIIVRCIKYKNIWIFLDKTISYCKICGMFLMNTCICNNIDCIRS